MHNFNITGLEPAAKELKSASSYAVLAPLDNFVVEFALHAINQNCANDIYIVSQDVESFFESSFSAAINTAYKRSKVHPFSLSSETQHYSIERINKGIIKEIGAYKKLKNALVFIHFNTELLSAATEASTKAIMNDYSEFAKKTGVTLLFLLSGPEVTHYRFLIRQLNKSFDGLIFVDNDSATRVLEYDYWHHTTGIQWLAFSR